MATHLKNLSDFSHTSIPSGKGYKVAIVVAEWNPEITNALLAGAYSHLTAMGVKEKNILIHHVPGSFELIYGADKVAQTHPDLDGIIVVGCVIRGATAHFDYVCQGVTQGVKDLNIKHNMPIIFCVLTDENEQQSIDRSGGKHGNKGVEAGVAAVMMADMKKKLGK